MLFSFFLGTVYPYRMRTAPGDPDARARARAEIDIDIAIGAFDFGDIDKICLVKKYSDGDPTNGLLGVVGQEELDRSFSACGKNLNTCCTFSSNDDTVLVIKRGNKISCENIWVSLNEGVPSPACAGPRELSTLITKIKKWNNSVKTGGMKQ